MHEALSAKQIEADRKQKSPAQKPSRTQEPLQRAADAGCLPLYTQVWGNLPPPWLRLSTSPQSSGEQPMQARQEEASALEHIEPRQRKENSTSLPTSLKAGIEALSGVSMDDVQVHYHSSKPAQLQALAYTQGTEIHVGPEQEQHLAHEAWHVVQQKKGKVETTSQIKGIHVNDDDALENEAEVMGHKAASVHVTSLTSRSSTTSAPRSATPIQLMRAQDIKVGHTYEYRDYTRDNAVTQGVLQKKERGGWYSFNNGKARGADSVLREVLAEKSSKRTLDVMEEGGEPTPTVMEESRKAALNVIEEGIETTPAVMEEGGKAVQEEEVVTIREMFLSYLDEKRIRDTKVINLLVDLNEKELADARQNRTTFKRYQADWTAYTSCFDTAERLFILLGNPANLASNSWENKLVLREAVPALIKDIQEINDSGGRCIYRIGVVRAQSQDHSFVIVIQNNSAELLQSFAGGAGEALGQNLQNKQGPYKIAALITLFTNLIDEDDAVRNKSQKTLFDGRIDVDHVDDKEIIRDLRSDDFFMRIDRRGLYDQTTLQKNIQAKIDANIKSAFK